MLGRKRLLLSPQHLLSSPAQAHRLSMAALLFYLLFAAAVCSADFKNLMLILQAHNVQSIALDKYIVSSALILADPNASLLKIIFMISCKQLTLNTPIDE